MTDKEQLWYLIHGLINGSYDTKTFCSEFSRIYNLETDYKNLAINEYHEFSKLCEMVDRFSDNIQELKIPNIYYCENDIKSAVQRVVSMLKTDK